MKKKYKIQFWDYIRSEYNCKNVKELKIEMDKVGAIIFPFSNELERNAVVNIFIKEKDIKMEDWGFRLAIIKQV